MSALAAVLYVLGGALMLTAIDWYNELPDTLDPVAPRPVVVGLVFGWPLFCAVLLGALLMDAVRWAWKRLRRGSTP